MKRNFKGIWIPREVYLADDISWSEKILLAEIDSVSFNGECKATNKYFATFLGVTEQSVSRSISKLRERGYIARFILDEGKRTMAVSFAQEQVSSEPKDMDMEGFERFWEEYGRKVGRAMAIKAWGKLTKEERKLALSTVGDYVLLTPEVKFRKHPSTWLNQRCFEDDYESQKRDLLGGGSRKGGFNGMVL